jgi:hypothetical protein
MRQCFVNAYVFACANVFVYFTSASIFVYFASAYVSVCANTLLAPIFLRFLD